MIGSGWMDGRKNDNDSLMERPRDRWMDGWMNG